MKYYIIVGEASGDLHGSNLIKGLKRKDPHAEFRFWGGDLMEAESGVKPVKHYKESSIMGFWEVVKRLRSVLRFIRECKADIKSYNPDLLILIDYGGFNMRIAKFAHNIGIRTYYYIPPKVWAWNQSRVKKIKKYVDRLFVIFPFEVDFFKKHGVETYYAGNPLVDSISVEVDVSVEDFSEQNRLNGKPIIALVPGSRAHEIKSILPVMAEASKSFPDYQFVVTAVNWLDRSLYDEAIKGSDVAYVCGKTRETLAVSSAALVTSGTATLETALMNIPQVVCFSGPKLSIWIASKVIKVPWISLVNLIMQREAVTELIQHDFTVESTIRELERVLPGGEGHDKLMSDYKELARIVGGKGASEKVAEMMYTLLTKEMNK